MLFHAFRHRLAARAQPPYDADTLEWADDASATSGDPDNAVLLAALAHADSSYRNVGRYATNCDAWVEQHFGNAPYMRNVLTCHTRNARRRYRAHRRFLASLHDSAGGEYFRGTVPVDGAVEWRDFGFQAFPFPGDKNPLHCAHVEHVNGRWMSTLHRLLDALVAATTWSFAQPQRVTSVLRGRDCSVSHVDPASVIPNRLRDDGVFSHAIIFRRHVKITQQFYLMSVDEARRRAASALYTDLRERNASIDDVQVPVVVRIRSRLPYDVYMGNYGLRTFDSKTYSVPRVAEVWQNSFADKFGVDVYRAHVTTSPFFVRHLPDLEGKRLGCWCAVSVDQLDGDEHEPGCHGRVIVEQFERVVECMRATHERCASRGEAVKRASAPVESCVKRMRRDANHAIDARRQSQ